MSEVPVFEEINFGSFRMSPQADKLFEALSVAQDQFGVVIKDKVAVIKLKTGGEYKYRYADLGSVFDACRKPMSANGLCVLQPASTDGNKVIVTTVIGHKSGQWIAADLHMTASDNLPQTIGTAISYGRRYSLGSMTGIVSEEDDDGKTASERQPKAAPKQEVRPAPKKAEGEFDAETFTAKLKAARERLGDDIYWRVMGSHGFTDPSEIKKRAEAESVWSDFKYQLDVLKLSSLGVSEEDVTTHA